MSIEVNATEQLITVNATDTSIDIDITNQVVDVNATTSVINVDASNGPGPQGPQGPAGQGVPVGGSTNQVLAKASGTNYDTQWVNAGVGSVTSVDASGGVGISVTGGPIVSSGTFTITNTAPDQIVALSGAGTATISGTYPNFTITANDQYTGTVTSVNLTAGTGISVSGGPVTTSGSINVVNTAPDQVVNLTGTGTTTITGTYPNFTISSTDQYSGTVTSVNMTVPTGFTISGNPITSAGTLALAMASGYAIPTTASQANWDSAYNDKINSASVTGTTTKTLTLTQQDGGTITASWSDIDTGLTSVGLSMPSAFTVTNSPLTSNGTIAVTGAGTSAQYVRGDGQLANFPSTSGGGSSVNYYLNGSVSQGTFGGDTYYEMSKSPIGGAGTNFTRTSAQGNGYIASFITDANDPSLLLIPGGNWNLEFYFSVSSGGGTPSFYAELYKVSSSNVFTLVASGSTNPEGITQGTVVDQYFTSIPVAETILLATDRLAIRIYVAPDGRNIILHTENSNLCEVLTTFSTGLNALNGLTNQVQYFATGTSGTDFAISSATDTHTFNLPIASGTNTGKLSNTDWTTFNNKQNALTLTTGGSSGSSTLVGSTLNVPTYTLLGLGGVPTTRQLTINGTAYDLSADRSWSVGTVTSVNMSVPTGFAISGNPITSSGTLALAFASGYSLPTTLKQSEWDAAYNDKINSASVTGTTTKTLTLTQQDGGTVTASWTDDNTDAVSSVFGRTGAVVAQSGDYTTTQVTEGTNLYYTDARARAAITLTTTGSSGASTYVGGTLNVPTYTLNGLGGVPTSRTLTINGTAYDLSADRSWTIPTHDAVTIGTANGLSLVGQVLSLGLASSSANGALSSTDWSTFNNKQAALSGSGIVKSTSGTISYLTDNSSNWNSAYDNMIVSASVSGTTTKTLTLTQQDAGTITASWTDYDTAPVTSVFGRTGAVTAQSGDYTTTQVTEGTNLYYTEGRVSANSDVAANTAARHNAVTIGTANGLSLSTQALSLGLSSSSTTGALSSTDWSTFNAKQNAITLTTTGTSGAATLVGSTLNIPQYADQFVGTVTSVAALTIGTTGTDLSSSVANGTTTPVITLNVPTASATNRGALSSADWTTFNSKQNAITLTTTGTSGAATLVGATLNIPNYAPDLSGYVPTSRTITINGTSFDLSANRSYSVGTVTSVGLSSATSGVTIGSTPVTTSGTITLAIATASGSQQGLLSSTDWTTFNNKQSALTNPVTGTGTTNYLPKFTGTSTIGNSNLINDASGNLGLGVTPSAWATFKAIQINGGNSFVGAANQAEIWSNSYFDGGFKYYGTGLATRFASIDGQFQWFTAPSGTAGNAITFTQAMTLTANGRLLLGTTTEGTDLLQVNGSAIFSNDLKFSVGASLKWGSNTYIYGDNNVKIEAVVNGNTALTLASTGAATFSSSVGIGVSPSYKLDVFANNNASIAIAQTSDDPFIWFDRSDGGISRLAWRLRENAIRALIFETGSSATKYGQTFTEAMRITSGGNLLVNSSTDNGNRLQVTGNGYFSGNVGIGTTSPGSKLEVYGGNISLRLPTYLGTARYGFGNPARTDDAAYIEYSGVGNFTGSLIFATNGTTSNIAATERMRITPTGNLGIGTASPQAKLQVSSATSDGIIVSTTANVEPFIAFWRNSASNGVGVLRLIDGGSLYFDNGATGASQATKMQIAPTGAVRFNAYGSGSFTGTRAYDLSVDASGNIIEVPVGAGTITGSGTTNYIPKFTSSSAIGNSQIFDNGTNVGIGTSAPAYKLDVVSTGDGASFSTNAASVATRIRNTGNNDVILRIANNNSNFYDIQNNYSDNSFTIDYNDAERMRLDASGNLGLGTASPATYSGYTTLAINNTTGAVLDFLSNGTRIASINNSSANFDIETKTAVLMAFGTNGTERMRITSTGNLLVGTTTDAGEKLQVNGTMKVTGAATFSSSVTATSFIPSSATIPTNGMYLSAANTLNFATNSTNKITLTSTGNFVIGTPGAFIDYKLEVMGSTKVNGGGLIVDAGSTINSNLYGDGQIVSGASAQPAIYINTTWNTTGNPNGIELNVNNTASGASSKLINLKVDSASVFSVSKGGAIQTAAPSGGTAKPFKIGAAASVSPTSPNRTIEIEIDGTTYYLSAKTTND